MKTKRDKIQTVVDTLSAIYPNWKDASTHIVSFIIPSNESETDEEKVYGYGTLSSNLVIKNNKGEELNIFSGLESFNQFVFSILNIYKERIIKGVIDISD